MSTIDTVTAPRKPRVLAAKAQGGDAAPKPATKTGPKSGAPARTVTKASKPSAAAPVSTARPGIIARLRHHLEHGGGTVDQLLAKLVKEFPERSPAAMTTTVRVQMSQLPKKGFPIRKRTEDGVIHYEAAV